VQALPTIHKDPFDRMLIAQAIIDGAMLLSTDGSMARYGSPVRRV
jgi:PIN domain nuclease of toxin-antitoxin system